MTKLFTVRCSLFILVAWSGSFVKLSKLDMSGRTSDDRNCPYHRRGGLFLSRSFGAVGIPIRVASRALLSLLLLGEESRVEVRLVACD